MRKHFLDVLQELNTIEREVERIWDLFYSDSSIYIEESYDSYSVYDFVDEFCFSDWKKRNHYVDMSDLFDTIRITDLRKKASKNTEDFLLFIELIYNFWKIAEIYVEKEDSGCKYTDSFVWLQKTMHDCLAQINHIAIYDAEEETLWVIEDKPEVSACAEISSPSIARKIVKYNHFTLKGDLEQKKEILLALADEFEGNKEKVKAINPTLGNNISFMLNNLNVRHNNISEGSRDYKSITARMNGDTIEQWYDELYQMLLLAKLLIDNVPRENAVNELKRQFAAKQP